METKVNEIRKNLARFTGSMVIYEMPYFNFLYTEGIKYMAEACNAVWLLTDAGIECSMNLAKKEEFIVVKLIKNDDDSAELLYENGNGITLKTVKLTCTDFPLKSIMFYFTNNTFLLPSEN